MRLQRNIIEINEGNTTVEMAIMKRRGEGGERGGGKEPQKSVWTTFSGFLHFHL